MSYQLRFPDMVAMASVYTESRGKCCMPDVGDKLENKAFSFGLMLCVYVYKCVYIYLSLEVVFTS